MTDMRLTAEFSRKAAAQGTVLLKNDGQILPFRKGECIAVFGRSQIDTCRSGTGSGGRVNAPYAVNLTEGLQNSGIVTVESGMLKLYQKWIRENPFDNAGGKWAGQPWAQKEMRLNDENVENSSKHADKALVIFGRTAGEDKDNRYERGSYLLSPDEEAMLCKVAKHFERIVVLLNTGNVIDMGWLDRAECRDRIKAVVMMYQGGQESGNAIADVLTGKVPPSGKLTDTIAKHINDYPSTVNFGDELSSYYQEDIYVGYRYFETFAPDRVRFPFGFGLSYTTFSIKAGTAVFDGASESILFSVEVRNSGSCFSGREVIQIYYGAPQGKLGKAVKSLIRFAKTKELKPGEKCELVFSIPVSEMASYDDSGCTGYPYAYVLEEGDYPIYAGSSVRCVQEVFFAGGKRYHEPTTRAVRQLEQVMPPVREFRRIRPVWNEKKNMYQTVYESVPLRKFSLRQRIISRLPEELPQTGDRGITLYDVRDGVKTMDEFIGQMSDSDLAAMARGEGMGCPKVTAGTGGALGGVSDALLQKKVPLACGTDGPNGIRLDSGAEATQVPVGTLLASTWDESLVEKLFKLVGMECRKYEIDLLFGPGMNIHRNPLCGRNFEYFSEDPYVSGRMATAICRGLQTSGVWGTVKHLACNNQENGRFYFEANVSERALREIYLRGFQITVEQKCVQAIMTSYNRVNGFWSASNYDLNTTVLRREWGYRGIVLTDWWANINHVVNGGAPDPLDTASMVRAGNNLYMVVNNYCAADNAAGDNLLTSLKAGTLTRGEMQRNAKYICGFLMGTLAFTRNIETGGVTRSFKPMAHMPSGPEEAVAKPDETGVYCLNLEKNERVLINPDKAQKYQVYAAYRCPGRGVTQSTVNILMNGTQFITLVANGTRNQWVSYHLLNVQLQKGRYEISLRFARGGLQMKEIRLVPAAETHSACMEGTEQK